MCDRCGPRKDKRSYAADQYRELYRTNEWRKASEAHRAVNVLCVHCLARGVRTYKDLVVDHIRDHKGDPELFWDPSNWQTLCRQCNSRKGG